MLMLSWGKPLQKAPSLGKAGLALGGIAAGGALIATQLETFLELAVAFAAGNYIFSLLSKPASATTSSRDVKYDPWSSHSFFSPVLLLFPVLMPCVNLFVIVSLGVGLCKSWQCMCNFQSTLPITFRRLEQLCKQQNVERSFPY
jgi:hypothetical protein